MAYETQLKSMLFDEATIAKTDYQTDEIYKALRNARKPVHKRKPPAPLRAPFTPLKIMETMCEHKPTFVAFNLFHKDKDIIRTNPTAPINIHMPKSEQKSRAPRGPPVFMVPAVCMDEVEEPTRSLVISKTYQSSYQASINGAVSGIDYGKGKSPLPPKYSPPNPMRMKRPIDPVVPDEWRMQSLSWDNKNLRAYFHATEQFWLRREKKQVHQ